MDRESCLRALAAHDPRFDGVFFVGVLSTRIYCRPVCPARPPRRDKIKFFANAAAAERMGFRPCLRCRPELAPGLSRMDATTRVARAAAARIAEGALNGKSVDDLAKEFGVSGRQLRRVVESETGVTPIALAQTHRLLMAKRLLTDTQLSMTQVAFASGFQSVRRFDDLFQSRYRMSPSALRKKHKATAVAATSSRNASHGLESSEQRDMNRDTQRDSHRDPHDVAQNDDMVFTLGYRPPLAWKELLGFLAGRATPGVEFVDDTNGGTYARVVSLDGHTGTVRVSLANSTNGKRARKSDVNSLRVQISTSLSAVLMPLLGRVRHVFDLDAEPDSIAEALSQGGLGARKDLAHGLRVPGAVDGFELALRAVLGQQVSVKGATTLAGRFAERFGSTVVTSDARLRLTAPQAQHIAQSNVRELMTFGVTGSRAASILELSRAVSDKHLRLEPGVEVSRAIAQMVDLPGIGDWTAQYVAMRALRWPDAFPASDLWLRRAAGDMSESKLRKASEQWRPWRSYAAMHLWHRVSSGKTIDVK